MKKPDFDQARKHSDFVVFVEYQLETGSEGKMCHSSKEAEIEKRM
jgi:hypothetical protein